MIKYCTNYTTIPKTSWPIYSTLVGEAKPGEIPDIYCLIFYAYITQLYTILNEKLIYK